MKLTLIEKSPEAADCISFILSPDQPFSWIAGQYMSYQIEDPQADDRGNQRFFTIATAPFEENLMLTTRFLIEKGSSFKKHLQSLEVGQTLEATGPHGNFILENPDEQSSSSNKQSFSSSKEYVFIAGGIGITPFRAILLDLDHQKKPINITLLYGNRDQNVVYKNLLEEIATRNPNFKIHYIFEPQRIDQQTLKSLLPKLATNPSSSFAFYISGPEPMVEKIKQQLLEIGIPDEQIKTDYFPGYDQ